MTTTHRRAAFTLIELLVVIAIIGVLSGIVLSVVASVRQKADTTTCLSNLRQQGAGFNLYAADHNMALPLPTNNPDPNGGAAPVSWLVAVGYYVNVNVPQNRQKSVELCPTALQTYPNGMASRTYAMNMSGTDGTTPQKLARFSQPSQTALTLDSAPTAGGGGDGIATFGLNDIATTPQWRHQAGISVLFLDGHAQWLDSTQKAALVTYGKNFSP